MPKSPTWIDKVNFAQLFIMNGCETTLFAYLETGGKALSNLAMLFLTSDAQDVVRSVFRPQGLRSKRHGRKGRKGGKGNPAIPEVSDLVADRIQATEEIRPRTLSDGPRSLWALDGLGQRLLYKLMIVDGLTDFMYDWQSGIVMHEDSDCPNIARNYRKSESELIGNNDEFGTISLDQLVFSQGMDGESAQSVLVPNGNFLCTIGCIAKNNGIGFAEPQIRIGTGNAVSGGWGYSSQPILGALSTGELLATCFVQGPAEVRWQAMSLNQDCDAYEWKCFIMQMTQ